MLQYHQLLRLVLEQGKFKPDRTGTGTYSLFGAQARFPLSEGFPLPLFVERTGLPLIAITATLDRAEAKGLIVRDHLHAKPTELGRRFQNDLLEMFLPH